MTWNNEERTGALILGLVVGMLVLVGVLLAGVIRFIWKFW